jgi:hypothetical protein
VQRKKWLEGKVFVQKTDCAGQQLVLRSSNSVAQDENRFARAQIN